MNKEYISMLMADASQFHHWLLKRQAEIVGFIGNQENCPLANWLLASTDEVYYVGRNHYGVEGSTITLPSWAWFFVHLLEVQPEGAIDGKDALAILESIYEYNQESQESRKERSLQLSNPAISQRFLID